MKVVYIAHPISEDDTGNLAKILHIIRDINMEEPDVIPFAPYFADVMAMNDDVPEERDRGMRNNHHYFESGFIDELWLFGDHISGGMHTEIGWAMEFGIKIRLKSKGVKSVTPVFY